MKKLNRYYILLIILTIAYAAFTLLIPPDASVLVKYGLTPGSARVLTLSVILPFILIWLVAFYGFIAFKDYAQVIKSSKDGKALSILAQGLMFLAVGLPVSALASSVLTYVGRQHPSAIPTTVIITNYLTLIIIFVAFYTLNSGARYLLSFLKKQHRYDPKERFVILCFFVVSVIYSYVTLSNPSRQFAQPGVARAAYYLPDLLLVLTIIIPYLCIWYYGIRTVYSIRQYQKQVKGTIYKQALTYLEYGIAGVVVSSMAQRFLASAAMGLEKATLKGILVILYVLLVIIAIGYVMIAIGAKKLKKIEEV